MGADRSNLVLIGMPGAGKSTVGVLVAKRTRRAFLDTDLLIQSERRQSLQDILDGQGYVRFREIEEAALLALDVQRSVIATGGSAVYSAAAMQHLKEAGVVVFLDTDLDTLQTRLEDFGTRGIARAPGQSLEQLYRERRPLYAAQADLTIDCGPRSQGEISAEILAALRRSGRT